MTALERTATFLDIFRYGMLVSQQRELQENLGNRERYLGLSDLAKYQECPRNAIAAKIMGKPDDLATLLTLGRGHWFEQGVADSLSALGLNQMRQVEISWQYQDAPVKGHLDIVLVWEKPYPAVRILEIKSMENLPQAPYASHQWQITAQTGLLKACWNKPVFGEGDLNNLPFPQLCRQKFGINMPEKIADCSVEGWLLCLSMTELSAFGPFISDTDFLEDLNIKAVTMWRQLNQYMNGQLKLNDIPFVQGYYPLCSWCSVNSDCPKFDTEILQQECEVTLARLDRLKDERAGLDNEIKEIENSLKLAHQKSGCDGWINTGNHRFKVINSKGRSILDKAILVNELEDLFNGFGIKDMTVDDFISRCEHVGAPSSRLSIQPIRQEN